MKYYYFILLASLADFRRNKMRTMLTSLGIMIGVFSVVLLIAVGLGLRKYIQQQFESFGANLLFILPGGSTSGSGTAVSFDERDISRLANIPGVQNAVPMQDLPTKPSYGGKELKGSSVVSTSHDMLPVRNIDIAYGRNFTEQDNNKRAKVVVIGQSVAEDLYGSSENSLNKQISFSGQRYKIIGVIEKVGGALGGPPLDNYLFIPYKSGFSFINPDRKFVTIITKIENAESIPQVKFRIIQELKKKYDEEDFDILEQTDIINTINGIFGVVNGVLIGIAAISLLVGGIGIMNIMYVTVSERIKEIGIRRALGARKGDILYQFLFESTILSLFGGLLGLGLAALIVLAVQSIFPAYIDGLAVFLALGVSSIIGIVFGVFPAKKAADLSPIEAIRYE